MKKGRIFVLFCLGLCFMFFAAPSVRSETETKDYIRLHILAESDSAWDQAVKLAVRDAVRVKTNELLRDCDCADDAWTTICEETARLEEAAREALGEWGSDADVTIQTGVFDFPERVYGDETVPAGEYRAVRILLGPGEGKNWWCVLYPSLCLPEDADCETPVIFYSSIGRWLASLFGGEAS